MGVRLKVERHGYMRDARADDVLALLGVKAIPAEGIAEREINGVRVYARPLVEGKGRGRRNWQGLRMTAICTCGRHVAIGRLAQHVCTSHLVGR